LPALALELVRLKPDVILATATGPALAARSATASIPIVSAALADSLHLGLATSEARPGGNVTGISPYVTGLPAKQIELAREILPKATRVGVLTDMTDPKAPPQWQELEAAGRSIGFTVIAADVRTPEELKRAFQNLAKEGVDEAIVLQTSMLLSERKQ